MEIKIGIGGITMKEIADFCSGALWGEAAFQNTAVHDLNMLAQKADCL